MKVNTCYHTELYKKQLDNFSNCNKEWPYCINDYYFENVKGVFDNLSFTKGKINYIDNYFFSYKQSEPSNKKTINVKEEEDNYNILLERRPHFCSEIQDEMNSNLNSKKNEIKEDKIKETKKSNNKKEDPKNKKSSKKELIKETKELNKLYYITDIYFFD